MAYISNSTNKVKWGISTPQSSFPTPSFKTANSTPMYGGSAALQNTINQYADPNAGQSKIPTSTPYKGTSAVASGTGGSTAYSAPATQQSSTNQGLQSLMTGLQGLSTALGNYQNNQTTKGLVKPPKKEKKESSQFSKFTGGLMDASQPSKSQRDYLRKLERQSQAGKEAANRAAEISDMYGGEIARVGKLGAGAVAGAKTTGTDVVGRGNAAIASESASNRINALSAAQAAALQGTGQQLTAAEQGITGLTSALQGANTMQAQGIQALGTGGTLSMPSPAAYGQTVFDPTQGGFAGGNMDPQTQATNLAQQVMSGAMTYDQALASMGYAGTAGTNFLNNAITGAGGNPLQLQAQNVATQANIATQGTAGTDIARQGLQTATNDYVQMNTAAQFANSQAQAVSSILQQTGLNNISSTDYNKALNELKGRFSDVNFAALNTALTEAQVAYTNLLSTGGGTPTGREAQALNTLNINQSAGAINASIQELENAVARRLQAQYGAMQQYNQNLGSGATFGGGTGGGGFAETW